MIDINQYIEIDVVVVCVMVKFSLHVGTGLYLMTEFGSTSS